MKKSLIFIISVNIFAGISQAASEKSVLTEARIIKKITKFRPQENGEKPYSVLKKFLLTADACNIKKLAQELEGAYKKRKDEPSNGKWIDYVPYCMSYCFLELLQASLNPKVFKNWTDVANAVAFYCSPKNCNLSIADIKAYYRIRYSPTEITGTHFLYCKEQARAFFVKDGSLSQEKLQTLKNFRAFARLHGDTRMKALLSAAALLSKK